MTTPSKAPPRDPLEVYEARLIARDKREKQNETYIKMLTEYQDKCAALENAQLPSASESVSKGPPQASTPETKSRSHWGKYYRSSGGKSSPTPPAADPAHIAQLRADLAVSNKVRSEQEAELKSVKDENAGLKATAAKQTRRIADLEKKNHTLEHRVKDMVGEVKMKSELAAQSQDEMVAMQVEVNGLGKQLETARGEVRMLTDRWMVEKDRQAREMNENNEKKHRRK